LYEGIEDSEEGVVFGVTSLDSNIVFGLLTNSLGNKLEFGSKIQKSVIETLGKRLQDVASH